MSDKPTTIKGRRLVGALGYYHCDHCGAPRGRVLNTGLEGCDGNWHLVEDGALFFWREAFARDTEERGIRLLGEVGRTACPHDPENSKHGDHVYYDWEWTE